MDECACPAAIVANEGQTVVAKSSWIEIPNEQAHQSWKQKNSQSVCYLMLASMKLQRRGANRKATLKKEQC
jgi:hypothetical protein